MLEVKDLKFSYGDFEIHAELEVHGGEILTLLGPNGSGKTTLLKCIHGILKPVKSCVYIDGKDIHSMSIRERAEKMAYVPQTHHPSFPYTVLEFVVMGAASKIGMFEVPKEREYKRARQALKIVGIEELAERPYTKISGGQLQLALIARALVQDPKAILFDEPTAHLDFRNQIRVMEVIKRVTRDKNISTILTLHDPNLAGMYSNRIALLKEGRIHRIGEPKDVLTEKELEFVYGISVKVLQFDSLKLVVPHTLE